jgi:uncharacterized protein (DUF302 family)
MSYYFSRNLDVSFEDALRLVFDKLKEEGQAVLTDIDIQEVCREKLNVDFGKYRILGVCSPRMAYDALMVENKIGALMPCNIIIRETDEGHVEVSSVDPVASMIAVRNDGLKTLALQLQSELRRIVETL